MARGWSGCFNCGGRNGCPRASPNSTRCTAGACKTALTAQRAAEKAAAPQPVASQAAAGEDAHEEMPETMWVHELQEILGERACVVRKLSKVQLKCGPRSAARQQFLVRGSFLVDVEDVDMKKKTIRLSPTPFGCTRPTFSRPLRLRMSRRLWRRARRPSLPGAIRP